MNTDPFLMKCGEEAGPRRGDSTGRQPLGVDTMKPTDARAAIATMSDELRAFENLAKRFAGVDLQYRRATNSPGSYSAWPVGSFQSTEANWRARCVVSKNERDEYRITVYATDMAGAIEALLARVAEVDAR